MTVKTITFEANFNTTSTTLIGNAGSSARVLTLNGPGSSPLIKLNTTSGSVTFQPRNSGSADLSITLAASGSMDVHGGANLVISCAIAGSSKALEKTSGGILTLSGANTYSGDTTITAGTLALSGSGSIASSPSIIIAGGGTFDVSGLTTALALASGQALKASATGASTTATITTLLNKGLTLSAGGLAFTAYGGGATAPLTVAGTTAGTLALNSAPVTVTTTTVLSPGTYKLVAKSGSASVTGTPGTLSVNGSGLAAGTVARLVITSGELFLQVSSAPSISAQPSSTSACVGSTAGFSVTASGTQTPSYSWAKRGGGWGSAWTKTSSSGGTSFKGSSTDNDFNDTACTSFGANDINSSTSDQYALGIYGGTTGDTTLTRTFTALTSGQAVSIHMDNGNVETGKKVGFGLQTSGGADVLQFYYLGGSAVNEYKYNDGTERGTGKPFQRTGIRVQFMLTSSSTYTLAVTPCGGTAAYFTGTYSGSIAKLKLFNQNVTGNPDHNAYFNRFIVGGYVDDAANYTGDPDGLDKGEQAIASGNGSATYTTPILVSGDNGNQYEVVVYNDAGVVLSSAATLTVNAIPSTPTAGNNGPVCSGSTLSLTASTISSATYSWTGPNGYTSSQQNPTVSSSATAAMAGTYTVTAMVGGCTSSGGTTAVTVNTTPSAPTAGNNGPVCSGSTLILTASTISGATYSWTGPNGYTSSQQNPTVSSSATAAMAGTYAVMATVGGCTSAGGTTVVTVNALPAISSSSGDQTVCANSSATYSVTASGAGLSYQWNLNGTPLSDGGIYANVKTDTLTVTPTSSGQSVIAANGYDCTVSGTCTPPVTSTRRALTVSSSVAIGTQPTAQTGCSGSSVNFSVGASGASPTYNWRKRGSGWGNGWAFDDGSPAGAHFLGSSGAINTGGQAWGINQPNNATAEATRVLSSSLSVGQTFRMDMQNGNIDNGGSVGFGLQNNGHSNNRFEFYFKSGQANYRINDNGSNNRDTGIGWVNTGLHIEFTLTGADTYSVSISPVGGGTPTTFTGTLTGTSGDGIDKLRLFNYYAGGGSAWDAYWNNISYGGSDDNAGNYTSWSGDKGQRALANSATVSGSTTPTLTLSGLTTGQTGESYDVVVGSACGTPVTSSAAALTVNATPSTPTANNNGPVCAGTTLSLSTPTVTDATYSWTGPNGFTSSAQNPTVSTSATTGMAGTYNVTVTVNGCTSAAGSTTVTVTPLPAALSMSGTGTFCTSAGAQAFGVSGATETDVSYQLYQGATAVGSPVTGTGSAITFAAQSAAGTYTVQGTRGTCTILMTGNATITTSPTALGMSGTGTFCTSAGAQAFGVSGVTESDVSYQLLKDGSASGMPAAQNGNGGAITFAAQSAAGTYTVQGTRGSCATAMTGSATITASPTALAMSGTGTFCTSAGSQTFGVSGATESTVSYQLLKDGSAAGMPAAKSGTGSAITFTAQSGAGSYTIAGTRGTCTTTMTGGATINQTPTTPSAGNNGPVCSGTTLSLSTPTVAGATYSWTGPNGFTSSEQNPTVSTSATTAMAGTYNVTVAVNGCTSSAGSTTVTVNSFALLGATTTIFSENMGTPSGTTTLAANVWQNSSPITFTSTSTLVPDVRITTPSSTYVGASGSGNVFFTTTTGPRNLVISGINTVGYGSIQLQFGAKQDAAGSGDAFVVEVSTDGSTYSPLTITQPTTSWSLITASGTIPATSNLRIRFSKSTNASYRLDDVKLTGQALITSASITAGGPTTFCAGGSVVLTATAGGTHYAWVKDGSTSVGSDSATYSATASGSYTATISDANGCASTSSATTVTVNAIPSAPTAGSDSPRLPGSTLHLTASAVSGGTYAWTGPNGFSSSDQNPTIANVTRANAGQYSVTVTVNGCTSAAGTTTLVVNTPPTVHTPIALGAQNNIAQTLLIVGNPKYPPQDADSDTLTVSAVTQGSIGSVTHNTTSVTYTASNTGTDSFTYTVDDGYGGTAVGTVNVTVSAVVGGQTASITFGGHSVSLVFWGVPGETYTIQRKADLEQSWSDLGDATANGLSTQPYGQINFTDSNPPSSGSGYYRLKP